MQTHVPARAAGECPTGFVLSCRYAAIEPCRMLGETGWEGVVLAGVAIIAACLWGRRSLWPDRPDAAWSVVVLLVCSSQFLIRDDGLAMERPYGS